MHKCRSYGLDKINLERRRGGVIRTAVMVQNVAVKYELEAGLRHAMTGKLSLSTQRYMGTFFELGKDKAAEGEGWAPPFISYAQDTVGVNPHCPYSYDLYLRSIYDHFII